jgi:hypothetical protein
VFHSRYSRNVKILYWFMTQRLGGRFDMVFKHRIKQTFSMI